MSWYLTGLVWLLQIIFWGLGLSWLVPPRRWRRFWPAFCPVLGLSLQSAVVWAGAHTAVRGTDGYAAVSLLLPAGLLVLGAIRNGGLPGAWTLLLRLGRWWPVLALMTLSFSLQVLPFTKPPALLTSSTLGSCDPADYAAGARVFKEFSSRDRSGFLGETEVVRVLEVDNFFDFFLQLNHFTPSALIAFEASLLNRQPFELTSLLGAVLLTLHLPGVFWLARSGFRLDRLAAFLITAIYGFSPVLFYALYQNALGQLLAAPAVALLTWVGVRAYHDAGRPLRRYLAYSGLLLACNWLILGSYNFFILFAYVPLVAYVGGYTLWRRAWREAWRWCLFVGASLLACTLLFPGRVLSLADRLLLFDKTPFGWRIPAFAPSGWYGVFADAKLAPASPFWSLLLGAAGLLTLLYALLGPLRRRPRVCALAGACSVPIFIGYAMLLAQQDRTQDNASYDAYKLLCGFYPGILAALCLWMGTMRRGAFLPSLWSGALALVFVVCNVAGVWKFNAAIRQSFATVDRPLAQLSTLERMPGVSAVNICLTEYWPRLWANYFLLDKPQYFSVPTYEGRRITPLRGQWDLYDNFISIRPFDPRDMVDLNKQYYLVKHLGRDRVQAWLASGWYIRERDKFQSWRWCWGNSQIELSNPHPYPLEASVALALSSVTERHIQIWSGSTRLWEGVVGQPLMPVKLRVTLPTGATVLRLETTEPPTAPHGGEGRTLTFALYQLQIDLLPPP